MPLVARKLGLTEAAPVIPAASLEITAINQVDAEIVEYMLGAGSRAAGRRLSQMALPDGSVVAMITRDKTMIPPRGSTLLQAGDHLFVVLKPDTRDFVDQALSGVAERQGVAASNTELRLKGYTKVEDLAPSYGIKLSAPAEETLDAVVRLIIADNTHVGATVILDDVQLRVVEMVGQRIATVAVLQLAEN